MAECGKPGVLFPLLPNGIHRPEHTKKPGVAVLGSKTHGPWIWILFWAVLTGAIG